MYAVIMKSKPILQDAVTLDHDKKVQEAIQKYIDGVTLLMEGLSCEDSSADEKETLRNAISKYMSRAECLKGQAKIKVVSMDRIQIQDNSVGHTYESIFSRCFDEKLTEINVNDPYIIAKHQMMNFIYFCEMCCIHAKELMVLRLKTMQSNTNEETLYHLKISLASYNVQLHVVFDGRIHDREIAFNNGWIVKIGRGFDFFKDPGPFALGMHHQELRKCRETTIDIFKLA